MRLSRLEYAIAASAALAIAGALFAPEALPLHYVFKPLTTLLLILLAWRSTDAQGLRVGVVWGLGLSLVGDIALMLPVDAFAIGLGAFLLAHLAYIAAFRKRVEARRVLGAAMVYALVATGLLMALLPRVPATLQVPVLVYVAVLVAMAAFALGAAGRVGGRLALGGALFVFSDSLIAWDRFAAPIPFVPLWVLSSYWAAQWCIACSVGAKVVEGARG